MTTARRQTLRTGDDGDRQPLRVGVVGAGWGAGLQLAGFRRTGRVELTAITSRTRENAERTAAEFGVRQVMADVAELVAAVDIVCVATPPNAHLEPTLAAIDAGRHVLCDKPLALDAGQAGQMLAAATKAGVRHATGFVWRLDPAFGRIRELLAAGTIGAPRHVQTTCAMGVPVLPHNWMYERASGGGALMQHGSHMIDRVRHLLDAEITEVTGRLHHDVTEAEVGQQFHNVLDVFSYARQRAGAPDRVAARRPVTADTGYEIIGCTADGVRVSLWEAWHAVGPAEDQVVVYGEAGTLEWTGRSGLRLLRPGAAPQAIEVAGSGTSGANTPRERGLGLWHQLADAFLDTIAAPGEGDTIAAPGDGGHLPTLYDGWQVMRVVDAVARSNRSGRWEDT
jgi:predicted dehydrogenase